MADQSIIHTAEIIKAALPYIDSRSKVRAEFFAKMLDMMGSLRSITTSNNMAACGFENTKIDLEGLLNGIRPLCSSKEKEFIDRILNFFNMRRMFEMYNNMMQTMKTMQEFGGFPFGDNSYGDDTDNVTGNFSNSNFESIFRNFGNSSDTDATGENNKNDTTADSNFGNSDSPLREEDEKTNSETDPIPPAGNTGPINNKMLEMFKAILPPEQVSTFENLSMLLNTMSYDNNSKPDNKEHSDG